LTPGLRSPVADQIDANCQPGRYRLPNPDAYAFHKAAHTIRLCASHRCHKYRAHGAPQIHREIFRGKLQTLRRGFDCIPIPSVRLTLAVRQGGQLL
jgi:hypothetical protein